MLELTEPFLKVVDEEDEDDLEEGYQLTEVEKKKAESHLWLYVLGLATLVEGTLREGIPDLVAAGARYGGSTDQVRASRIAHEVMLTQVAYADKMKEDLRDGLAELLGGKWETEDEFVEDVQAFMGAAESRARQYAVGGGQPAWRAGAAGAAREAGYRGGIWICTFAPGSCPDCIELHGEWLTWDDFEALWGNTQCNGGCLCGFTPADNPDDLSPEELAEVDESVEAF